MGIDLIETVKRFVQQTMNKSDREGEFEPSELEATLSDLRTAVEKAIAKDKEEAHNFWTEIGSALFQGFAYQEKRRKFEKDMTDLVNNAMKKLAALETLVGEARGRAEPAIAELESSAAEWQEHAQQIYGIKDGIDQVRFIEGWEGPAAQEYSQACVVQGNATWELAGVVQSAGAGFETLAVFNRALLQHINDQVLSKAKSDIMGLQGGGFNEFYKRTNNIIPILKDTFGDADYAAKGGPVAASGAELEMQVYKTWDAPNLLRPQGQWPTGTSQAGQAPGQTNQIDSPDGRPVTETPHHSPKPQEQDGTRRW